MNEPTLMKIKAGAKELADDVDMEWRVIETAPFGRDLELAVLEANEVHALVFPCRRVLYGWVKAKANSPVNVHPTHWREWDNSVNTVFSSSAS